MNRGRSEANSVASDSYVLFVNWTVDNMRLRLRGRHSRRILTSSCERNGAKGSRRPGLVLKRIRRCCFWLDRRGERWSPRETIGGMAFGSNFSPADISDTLALVVLA
jgi:hypothetical protein